MLSGHKLNSTNGMLYSTVMSTRYSTKCCSTRLNAADVTCKCVATFITLHFRLAYNKLYCFSSPLVAVAVVNSYIVIIVPAADAYACVVRTKTCIICCMNRVGVENGA
jgi:hypothetical protein